MDLGQGDPARTRAEYFERWAGLHGGADPAQSWLVRGWLTFAYTLAKPLARIGLTPNNVTGLGLLVAASVPLAVWVGVDLTDRATLWLLIAGAMCAISGLLDNLDGAVAVITGRTTVLGYVTDAVADRIADFALIVALWIAGAPGPLAAAVAGLTVLQEYARARAGSAGMDEVGVVSLWERPTRVIVVAVFLGLAAWSPYGLSAADWASAGAWLGLVLAIVGCAQVSRAIIRRLRSAVGSA